MKKKQKHLGETDRHSDCDVDDKDPEPPENTLRFPPVLDLLRNYLTVLSSSNRDKHAELIDQGNFSKCCIKMVIWHI